jgi:predicted PurR-regulated permease PerM
MAKWVVPALLLTLILYLARSVLTPFVIAAVLAYVFSPVVDEIEERSRLPRVAVVAVIYIVLITALVVGIWLLETRLVREIRALSEAGPNLLDRAFVSLLGSDTFQFFGQQVDAHLLAVWTDDRLSDMVDNPTDALHVAERAFDTLLKTFLTLLALFYLLLDGRRIGAYGSRFVPPERRAEVERVGEHVHLVLGRYVRGQLLLIGIMSTATYLVLTFIFHLPFALPIAILTGILEVIPLLGPVAAGAVAATIGLVHGGIGTMIWIIVAYTVLRQVEDQVIMPIVVGRAVELHPLVTIFAVLVGAATAGVLGALLAVPAAAALRVLLDYFYARPPYSDKDEAALAEHPSS